MIGRQFRSDHLRQADIVVRKESIRNCFSKRSNDQTSAIRHLKKCKIRQVPQIAVLQKQKKNKRFLSRNKNKFIAGGKPTICY